MMAGGAGDDLFIGGGGQAIVSTVVMVSITWTIRSAWRGMVSLMTGDMSGDVLLNVENMTGSQSPMS